MAKIDGRWHLRATVVLADGFKMTQRPLVFVARYKRSVEVKPTGPAQRDTREWKPLNAEWYLRALALPMAAESPREWKLVGDDQFYRWPIESFTLADGVLTAQLGPPLP